MSDGSVVIDVELNDAGVDRGAENLVGKFKNVALAVTGIIGGLALMSKAVSAFTNLSKGAIQAAAGAQALDAQFEQVFGSIQGQAQDTINKLASDFGMVPSRIKPMFTQMTSQFKGLGLSTQEAAQQAAKASTLVADAAAFYDKSFEEANAALNSFVKGNYEGGESIGLFANETQLAAWAAKELGVDWKKLDEAGKQVARLQFAEAMQESAGATGQAARESDGLENVLGNLKAVWQDLLIELGTPVLPIVIGLMQRLTGIIQSFNFGPLIAGFSAIWDVLGQVGNAALDIISNIESAFGGGAGLLNAMGLNESVIATISGYLSTMKEVFTVAFDGIVAVTKYAFDLFKEYVPPIVSAVVSFVSEQLGKLTTFWQQNGDQIVKAVKTAFNGVKAVIDFIMPAIKFVVETVWGAIKNVISGALSVITGAIKVFSGAMTGDWSKMWEGIKNILSGAIDLIMGLLTLSFVGGIRAALTNLAKLGVNLMKGMWDDIARLFTNFSSSITGTVSKMATGIANYFKGLLTNAQTIFNTLRTFSASVWNAISQAAQAAVRTMFNIVKTTFTNMLNAIKSTANLIKSTIQTGWNKAIAYLKGIDLFSIGKNIIQGLINGIGSLAGGVYDKVKEIGSGLLSSFKGVLGIHSPSREMIAAGRDVVSGLDIGIGNGESTKKVMKDLGQTIIKTQEDNNKQLVDVNKKYKSEIQKVLNEAAKKEKDIVSKLNADLQKKQDSLNSSLSSKKKKSAEDSKKTLSKNAQDQINIRTTANKKIEDLVSKTAEKIKQLETKNEAEKAKIRAKADSERLEAIKTFINNKKELEDLSAVDEAILWGQSVKAFKDGTAAKVQAQKAYQSALSSLNDEIIKTNVEYQTKVADINTKLIEEERKLTEAYEKSVEDRTQSLRTFVGLFEEVDLTVQKSGDELTNSLVSQVLALSTWTQAFEDLSKRAVDQGLLEELRQMGPKALPELLALNRMTDTELTTYSALYKEKSRIAREQAVAENEKLRVEVQQKITELRSTADTELSKLEKEWVAKISSLRTKTSQTLDLKTIGKDAISGMMQGMSSMEGALVNRALSIANNVKSAISGAFDIHSPSRWMRDMIGGNMMKGWIKGIDAEKSNVLAKTADFVEWASPGVVDISRDFVNSIRGIDPATAVPIRSVGTGRVGEVFNSENRSRTFAPKITNHFTPAESTPAQNIKKQQQLLQRLGMEF